MVTSKTSTTAQAVVLVLLRWDMPAAAPIGIVRPAQRAPRPGESPFQRLNFDRIAGYLLNIAIVVAHLARPQWLGDANAQAFQNFFDYFLDKLRL